MAFPQEGQDRSHNRLGHPIDGMSSSLERPMLLVEMTDQLTIL